MLLKNRLSIISIVIIIISCFVIDFSLKLWENERRVIEYDVVIYYSYLPATFVFNDIELKDMEKYKRGDNYLMWPLETPNGGRVMKMSMGLAILYSPFFFIGHALSLILGYESIGFSSPYKFMLLFSTIFYFAIGLFFCRKVLLKYFTDQVTAISILLLGLGTNLLCYASQSAPMPHVYSFMLFAIFIYLTIYWHEYPRIKTSVFLGLTIGLIALIRPSNVLIAIFFLLYNCSSFHDIKNKFVFLISKYKFVFIMGIFAFFIWIPQFLYWKINTGNFLYYSYADERFFFNNPKLIDGLFSFRKGWLIYTPLMALSLVGIYFLKNELKKHQLAIIAFTILNLYVIFSWWCWWYGGTFGQRPLIDSYSLMIIPFTAFIKFIQSKKLVVKIPFYLICAFFIWLNIFQTYQFEFKSLHHDGMTKELYFKQFGKLNKINDFDKLVHWPNYEKAMKGDR